MVETAAVSRPLPVLMALVAGLVLPGCAGPVDPGATPTPAADLPPAIVTVEPLPDDPPVLGFGDELDASELPVLPLPSEDVSTFIQRVQALAGDSPDSGGPALGEDRTTVTLYWFGAVPDDVLALIDEYQGRVAVDVVATPFRPGDLAAEANRLVVEHAPTVRAVGPRVQGDGLEVLVETAAVERAGSLDAVLDGLDSPFPLFGEVGSVVPA